MLRLYSPIVNHDIFKLHSLLENVVCDVWCAADGTSCDAKLEQEFKDICHYSYKSTKKKKRTLHDEVKRIYSLFKKLSPAEKAAIKNAFIINNEIEKLCDGTSPIYLGALPAVVESDIKPLFKWCYETLLEQGKVDGDKMEYYNSLVKHPDNDFDTCPCCGLIDIESAESICREDYDHYLPKAHYPFASVNFKNLVPICNKCNRDRKKAKDPIENVRVAFYPFSTKKHNIEIDLGYKADIDKGSKVLNFKNLKVDLKGEAAKIETWDWLFHINIRYADYIRSKAHGWLRELANRYKRNMKRAHGLSYVDILDEHIEDYEENKYSEKKFLKIAFLKAIRKDTAFVAVYD